MAFWVYFAVWAVTFVIGEFLRPKPDLQDAQAAGLNEFGFPTASEARAIPVVWGTVDIEGPNLVWYGDYAVEEITEEVKTGLFSDEDVVVGHKYFVGLHLVLCHGQIDALTEIAFDDKVAWTGAAKDTTIRIILPELFGPVDEEGGLVAEIDVLSGHPAQAASAYLQTRLTDVPAYRGVSALVFRGPSHSFAQQLTGERYVSTGFGQGHTEPYTYTVTHRSGYVGNRPQLSPPRFQVKRLPRGLGNGYHDVAGDANPAEILYEILTDLTWGAGLTDAVISRADFEAAAQRLHTEGFGLSLSWEASRNYRDILAEVLRHIDGLLYTDITTGKLRLVLARDDYSPAGLPVLDAGHIMALDNYARTAWDETTNEVKVIYPDREAQKERTVVAQDLANWHIQGGVVSTEIRYLGVRTRALANKLAYRDLRALTYPLAKCRLKVNRRAYDFHPGKVFVLNWPPLGLEQIVMRVGRINYGSLTDGTIELDAVEDLFSLADSIYADPPPTGWQDPVSPPQNVSLQRLLEMPYHWQRPEGTLCRPLIAAGAPSGDSTAYDLFAAVSGEPLAKAGRRRFTPTGLLSAALSHTASTLVLDALDNPGVIVPSANQAAGRNVVQIDDELIAYQDMTLNPDGSHTLTNLWRGVMDTVPAAHAEDARVWFVGTARGSVATLYVANTTLALKYLTLTPRGRLPIANATLRQIGFTGRAQKPYPPADLRVNNSRYPAAILGQAAMTWRHRDRLAQSALLQQTDASVGPEAGVSYTLRIRGETDALLKTESGLVGTSYSYSAEHTDSNLTVSYTPHPLTYSVPDGQSSTIEAPRLNGRLRVELESVRSSLTSTHKHNVAVDRSGYGYQYGNYYGGV
jgi:hypothetical protein